jgi:threonine dehydratase
VTVSEDEIIRDIKYVSKEFKMIVEPTGCLGIAGLKKKKSEIDFTGKRIGVLITGGNTDLSKWFKWVTE